MRKNAVIVIVMAFAAVLTFVNHRKVITTGEYLRLTIGSTKDQALSNISKMVNVSSLQPRLEAHFQVCSGDLTHFEELKQHNAIVVSGSDVSATIYLDETRVIHIALGFEISGTLPISVAQTTRKEAFEKIETYVRSGSNRCVFPTAGRRPPQYKQTELVDFEDSKSREWLKRFDVWYFRQDDRYANVTLFFTGDKLKKIVFINNFIELP